ncbi:hypothetical protein FD755_015102, partial [Muntiacus reevesi]
WNLEWNLCQKMSTEGSKYVNKEIKNALKEVKQIKTQTEQTNEEHKLLHSSLEEAKMKKSPVVSVAKPNCVIPQDALNDTRDSETKLEASQGCKPCLKQTCVQFYARLEEFLNQSPFYFWTNGDRIDSLMENDRQQSHAMDVMEDSVNQASNIMDELFEDRFFPQRPQDTQYYFPFSLFPREAQQSMDAHLHRTPYHFPMTEFSGGDPPESTGCLWMKDQCEKCQEILELPDSASGPGCVTRLPFVFIPVELSFHISAICLCSFHLWADCSANNPTQTLLRQQLNVSLQLLLQSYQQNTLNTSALLKQLNKQSTWVSQLASLTQNDDQDYRVSRLLRPQHSVRPHQGVVKLFNSFPITVMVPQEVSRPDFMENVAEKALQQYHQKSPSAPPHEE